MKRIFVLRSEDIRRRAQEALWDAPDGYQVALSEPPRTLAENSLLHALITEVSKKKEWAGKKRDVETWKRLLVASWFRAIGEPLEILPALDGNGVDIIPVKTSKLSKKECAELIEYIYALGAENGIIWSELRSN